MQSGESAPSLQFPLPTMYDLPSESLEEPGLPDEFHDLQPQLLSRTLHLSGYRRDNYFTASDLNLYYDPLHPQWYKRADWFLAVDVPRLYGGVDLRRSYVTWYEQHPPTVVIEFLSPGTEADDLGRFHAKVKEEAEPEPETLNEDSTDAVTQQKPPSKLVVYEQYLKVPHYLVYSRQSQQLRYFHLIHGEYQEQPLNASNPLVWLNDLQIGLGIWQGSFDDADGSWLRWCNQDGTWFLTDTEQERFAKEQERLAKEQAEQQALQERLAKEQERLAKEQERLAKEQTQKQLLQAAQNLLASGMPREQIAALLNLSTEQIQSLTDIQN
jgi:Uma2 family endonuclease